MGHLKRVFRTLFLKKFDQFAKELGYLDWKGVSGNTFNIYHLEGEKEAWYYATQLSDTKWAIWKDDVGEPPYPFTVFSTWGEAIRYLRLLFEESRLPENHWSHEGWEEELRFLIDKETQIKILLYGSALDFACETLGVKDMRNHKYSRVFTVSKEEVYEYTSIHGVPQSDSTSRYSLVEGFHYFEEEGKWYTFFLERGHIYDEKNFDDYELGKKYIVTTLLQLSGTGLY